MTLVRIDTKLSTRYWFSNTTRPTGGNNERKKKGETGLETFPSSLPVKLVKKGPPCGMTKSGEVEVGVENKVTIEVGRGSRKESCLDIE